MRISNTSTGSATGRMGTNAEVSSQGQGQRKGGGRKGGRTGEWCEWGRAGCRGWESKMGTMWVLAECGCEAGDMSGCTKAEEKGQGWRSGKVSDICRVDDQCDGGYRRTVAFNGRVGFTFSLSLSPIRVRGRTWADMDSNTDETTLSFAESSHCTIYALTERSCWGGNETMDMLPALMECPGVLGCVSCVSQAGLMAHLPTDRVPSSRSQP